MSKAFKGVVLFTAIEVVGLVVWLILAGQSFGGSLKEILAVVALTGFLFGEHYVSVNVGNGRPAFGPLPSDKGMTALSAMTNK